MAFYVQLDFTICCFTIQNINSATYILYIAGLPSNVSSHYRKIIIIGNNAYIKFNLQAYDTSRVNGSINTINTFRK